MLSVPSERRDKELKQLSLSLLLLLATWFWYLGTPIETIIRVLLVASLQTLFGWHLLRLSSLHFLVGTTGALGLSASFGAVATVVLDQTIRIFAAGLGRDVVLVVTVLIAVTALATVTANLTAACNVGVDRQINNPSASESGLVVIVCAFALLIARGQVSSGRLIAATVFVASALIAVRLLQNQHALALRAALAISVSCVALAFSQRPDTSPTAWMYEPLYFGSDDLIFSEALSVSLSTSGPTEHIAAYGSSLRYHWLSLAWSGMFGRLANAEPLITSLHIAPTLGYLMICLLMFGIVRQFTTSRIAPLLGALILFATNYPIVDTRFIVVENTSNVLGHVWLLASVLLALLVYKSPSTLSVATLVITITATFMAKPHYVIPIVFAVALAVPISTLRRVFTRLTIAIAISSLVLLASTYVLFLAPNDWEQRGMTFYVDWFGLPTTGVFELLSPILALTTISVIVVGPLLLLSGYELQTSSSSQVGRVIAAAVFLSAMSSLFVTGNSSDEYILGAAISVGAPITGAIVAQLISDARVRGFILVVILSFTLISSWFLIHSWVRISSVVSSRLELSHQFPKTFQLLLPLGMLLCAGCVGFALHARFRPPIGPKSDTSRLLRSRVLVCVMMALIGSQVGTFLADMSYGSAQTQFAAPDDLEALQWIRENSNESWRIATNRDLCINPPNCTEGGSSFLVSAVTRVPVLIEGPRFVVGGQIYPSWVQDRISASLDFAQSPSLANLRRLTDFGVTHFYFDDTSPPGIPSVAALADVGVVIFEGDRRLVLDLKP